MKKYLFSFTFLFLVVILYINTSEDKPDQNLQGVKVEEKRLTGAEKFALYHSNIRKSPEGSPYKYQSGYQVNEYKKLKKGMSQNSSRALVWEERGPGNVSGRTRTVWLEPRDATGETWFVGSAQGGVWKTEDGGDSYVLKTPDVPHLGTAAIMGCTTSPDVIYAGSGEGFNFQSAAGAGIFKSIDGGESWTVLESTTNSESFANVLRLAVHPENPDIVLAATRNNNSVGTTDGFVMRSKDGGETWEEVLNHFDVVSHIVMSPDNGDVLYAGLNQEGVLKSVDGGDNWNFIWLYENSALRPGRIEIAISPSDPNYVYFTTPIGLDQPGNPAPDKIFVSDNAGETFEEIIPNNTKDDYSEFSGPQSYWNKAIAVDPFNPLRFYFAGLSAILRMDVILIEGLAIGEMTVITDGYNLYGNFFETSTKGVHVDHHGITFSVVDEASQEVILINTNDGGVAVSRDNGVSFKQTGDTFLKSFNPENENWETVNGYNVSTFYGVDKMNGADRYVGGTQDNGSWVSPENPDQASIWSAAPSGDGFEAAWNYDNPDQIIESSQFNDLYKSEDGGLTWRPINLPVPPPFRGPFISTIANSKQDGDMVMVSTPQGPALSADFGDSWTISNVPSMYVFDFLKTPIDISLADPNVVWTGTGVNNNNRICLSTDGGMNFTSTSSYEPQSLGMVTEIATHPADISTAFALFGTAGQPKVLRTTNNGENWEDISGFEGTVDGTSDRGFPDVTVFSLLVMPFDNNIIWAGTEIGIVESIDNGATWHYVDDALPSTAIWEMKIINDEVVVATHGRGIWTTSLPELEGFEPPTAFLIASKFDGVLFDKKLTGAIKHLTPIDSGMLTITVETNTEIYTRSYPFEAISSPTEEDINLNLEDFDTGDVIYDAKIEITSHRGDQQLSRVTNTLFYDVDAEDNVEDYTNDFDSGNNDFAIGRVSNAADFVISTPNGFENNGLESVHNFSGSPYRAILQKPINIPATGSTLSYDEVAILAPFNEIFGAYEESMIIEATRDMGKTWIQIAEYSSESFEEWGDAFSSNTDPTSDLYRKRTLVLSDYFDEGDEVYIKIEMNIGGAINTWGYILDNFIVEGTVSTKEELLEQGISFKTYMNPFMTSTKIELNYPNAYEVGKASLTDLNGQIFNASVLETMTQNGKMYEIDGTKLSSGVYFLSVRVGSEIVTEKIIKM